MRIPLFDGNIHVSCVYLVAKGVLVVKGIRAWRHSANIAGKLGKLGAGAYTNSLLALYDIDSNSKASSTPILSFTAY